MDVGGDVNVLYYIIHYINIYNVNTPWHAYRLGSHDPAFAPSTLVNLASRRHAVTGACHTLSLYL